MLTKFGMVTGVISLPELTYRITLKPFLIWLPSEGLEEMTCPLGTVSEALGWIWMLRFSPRFLSLTLASVSVMPAVTGM